MPKRRKRGVSGKFGPRYGFTLRKRWEEVESKVRRWYKCPSCGALKVRRMGTAIWGCRRCGAKFSGGAYSFTATGRGPTARGGGA